MSDIVKMALAGKIKDAVAEDSARDMRIAKLEAALRRIACGETMCDHRRGLDCSDVAEEALKP